MKTIIATSLTLSVLAGTAASQTINWNTPAGGLWNTPANWSPATVPLGASEIAQFNIGGTYSVNLNTNAPMLGSLNILDEFCTFNIDAARNMGLENGLNNDGVIVINPTNAGFQTVLAFNNSSSISGSGQILLRAIGVRAILRTAADQTLTHTINHTISGFGQIDADIVNEGTIAADVAGQILNPKTSIWSNNGKILVINDAIMDLTQMSITNNPGKEIRVQDGQLNINATTISNGTLRADSGSKWNLTSSSTFSELRTEGAGEVNPGLTLDIVSSLENNGTITVNPTNAGFQTIIEFQDPGTLLGTGEISLAGISTRSILRTATVSDMVTQSSGHTIRGLGRIEGSLINNGVIAADVSGQVLEFRINDQINNNKYQINNGAIINMNGITVDQSGGGTIDIIDGTLQLASTEITNGSISATSGSAVVNGGSVSFDNLTLTSDLAINPGLTLNISNGLANDSIITINPTNAGFITNFNFTDSSTLSGNGAVHLAGITVRSQINTDPGQTMTLESPHTISGFGRINASLINNSTITANTAGQVLELVSEDKANNSLLTIDPGATLDINGITLDQTGGGAIQCDDGTLLVRNTTIRGGTLESVANGVTTVSAASIFENLSTSLPTNVNPGINLNIVGTVVNNTLINVNPTNSGFVTNLNADAPAIINGIGEIRLSGIGVRSRLSGTGFTLGANQTLTGIGEITAPLTHNGILAIGNSVGEITASAPVTLTATSVMEVEVNNFNNADILDSSSTFHAAGTLDVELIDAFNPTTAWTATIVTADEGVTGEFDTIIGPPASLDPRLTFRVEYLADRILVGAVCDSDFDFNGEIDFFDISAFLTAYTAMDPAADFNNDGNFDFFDIAAFVGSYSEGCP